MVKPKVDTIQKYIVPGNRGNKEISRMLPAFPLGCLMDFI